MLRELSAVLLDIHAGLDQYAVAATARGIPITLSAVDVTLPLDTRVIFEHGGCTLLADVPRSRSGENWSQQRSALSVSWSAVPLAGIAEPAS